MDCATESQHDGARLAAELAARSSYGRLVALLASRAIDLASAEDALSEAFVDALEDWPLRGVPQRPEAWLLTVARRRLVDAQRRGAVRAAATLDVAADLAAPETQETTAFPDERLKLLFTCAHPAIDETARTPLMLQTVLGLDAASIAAAFLVSPTAMGQRLVRAKAKIRDAGIRFEVPAGPELPDRLAPVLDAVYVAYGSGWDDVAGADPRRRGLAREAIWLGELLGELLPTEPEVGGLRALMLYCEARRSARRGACGEYVPLAEQDCSKWSRPMIERAERLLSAAARHQRPGRYQLEAAIQSAHAQRAITGATNWAGVALLYEGLVAMSPTLGVLVGRAAAHAEAFGATAGLVLLDSIAPDAVSTYQPYWALVGHLFGRLGRSEEARSALERAAGLCEDPAVRTFLLTRHPPLG